MGSLKVALYDKKLQPQAIVTLPWDVGREGRRKFFVLKEKAPSGLVAMLPQEPVSKIEIALLDIHFGRMVDGWVAIAPHAAPEEVQHFLYDLMRRSTSEMELVE